MDKTETIAFSAAVAILIFGVYGMLLFVAKFNDAINHIKETI